mgnify:CR=1 FL=1
MSILEANNISFGYVSGKNILEGVNFHIYSEERVGIVAESGYGKSTFAKILSGYLPPKSGKVLLDGKEIKNQGFYPVQLIYQHPEKSINPKWKIKRALSENGTPDKKLLEILGIKDIWLDRYPNELSGGELQRIAIARAITKDTKFLIADEITAMLDGITQAQIWHSLISLSNEKNIGMIIITHNIALAKRICTRIVYLRKINHASPNDKLYE